MPRRRVHLTFPEDQVREPVIWTVGHQYKVVTSIRGANILDGTGWMSIEFEGDDAEIDGALDYLLSKGIEVDVIDDAQSTGGPAAP